MGATHEIALAARAYTEFNLQFLMYRPLHRAGRPHAIDEVLDEAQPIEVEHLLEITLGLTIAERQRYPPMSSPGPWLRGPRAKGFP